MAPTKQVKVLVDERKLLGECVRMQKGYPECTVEYGKIQKQIEQLRARGVSCENKEAKEPHLSHV